MNLTRPRRIILAVYLCLLAIACTWVPWKAVAQGQQVLLGYYFIWSPSRSWWPQDHLRYIAKVDTERVLLEIIALTGLCGLALLLSLKRRQLVTPRNREKLGQASGQKTTLNQAETSGRNPGRGSSQTPASAALKPADLVDKPVPPGGEVLDGPAWVGGVVVRVVSVGGMARTEAWTPGVGWTPSGINPAEVLMAPPAPDPEKERDLSERPQASRQSRR